MRRSAAISLGLLVACGCQPQLHVNLTYRAADRAWSVALGEPESEADAPAGPPGPARDVGADLENLLEALDP